ncbi:MAG: tetratricopeptide repeat protein [Chloroflexota bacterium]
MAGNREVYQQSMNAGHSAGWDQDWSAAIKAYSDAIQEFPEDGEAHVHLGLALLRAGRLDDSLKVYKRAHQLLPDDPVSLERSADILERLGRLKEAAQQYVNVADVYLGLKDLDKAIGNWERATQLTPGLVTIHARLARAYERVGDKKKALREYLTLAFNFQRAGDKEKATKAVERALRLDRRNSHALNTLRAIKADSPISLPNFADEDKPKSLIEEFGASEGESATEIADADPRGPLGEAMNEALVMLADYVVTSGNLDAFGASALQGMEFQRQGLITEAIAAYKQAVNGVNHTSLNFNLGALLYLDNEPDAASKQLNKALSEQKLAPGVLHGLGLSSMLLGKHKQASRYLIQSLQAVDTTLAMGEEERTELSETYNRLLSAIDGASEQILVAINERFADLLNGRDWKQRIAATRKHVEEVMRDQGDQGVRDFFGTGGSDRLASTVSQIDTYISQGLLTLAMDEAHRAVQVSPYYLPVHVRMAEILMREGRLRQAINKYNVIAKAYMARGENDRAATILSEVLEMAPLDVSVRSSLIGLLESEDRMDEVLDQYIDLANTYNQLGNFDMARETFQQAERLGRRIDAPPIKMADIKHNLAEMDQMRLDTRRAIKTYEEILTLVPDDDRAYRMLVDLNYSQNNPLEAIKHLDKLLGLYAKQRQISKMVQLLEALVKHYPGDTGLRSRLAAIYRQTGRKVDAIAQLDALGELQLEAGQHKEARNTIKQIISLKPDNLSDYKRLLAQLESQ